MRRLPRPSIWTDAGEKRGSDPSHRIFDRYGSGRRTVGDRSPKGADEPRVITYRDDAATVRRRNLRDSRDGVRRWINMGDRPLTDVLLEARGPDLVGKLPVETAVRFGRKSMFAFTLSSLDRRA